MRSELTIRLREPIILRATKTNQNNLFGEVHQLMPFKAEN